MAWRRLAAQQFGPEAAQRLASRWRQWKQDVLLIELPEDEFEALPGTRVVSRADLAQLLNSNDELRPTCRTPS